ncbi:MAG: GumC family protein [Chitinophagaceae bacterium]
MSTTELQNFDNQPSQNSKVNVKELLFKYLSFWPLFLFFIVVFVVASLLYLRYSEPTYFSSVKMLISDKSAFSENKSDIVTKAVFGSRPVSIENELLTIRSTELIKRVVIHNKLNVSYYVSGRINTKELFGNSPVRFVPMHIADSSKIYTYNIVSPTKKGAQFALANGKSIAFNWGEVINRDGNQFRLELLQELRLPGEATLTIEWTPINQTVANIQGQIIVSPYSEKTSIISISLISPSPARALKTLNGFVQEFINLDIEKKKEYSKEIITFINDKLKVVGTDLDIIEAELLAFRKVNRFLSVDGEYNYYQSKLMPVESSLLAMEFNLRVLDTVENQLQSVKFQNRVIPNSYGIIDPNLNQSISRYNALQLDKETLALKRNETSEQNEDLNKQLQIVKNDLFVIIKNIRSEYKLKMSDIQQKNDEYNQKIAAMPEKLQVYEEILRQKQLKQQLYNYLLSKREETELSSVSTKSNYEKMDPASVNYVPYSPKPLMVKLTGLLIGFAIPILIIFLLDFFNDKITRKEDITSKTVIPIAGEINHAESVEEIVIKNNRSVIAEQFRILRTNLQYLGNVDIDSKQGKTILVTSSISGEGKSFISLNLATVLAVTGKKVALLEFDLRKLQSLKIVRNIKNTKGISNYLIGQVQDPTELITSLEEYPNMHIFNTGSLPPNPAELVISERTKDLIVWLKANYDYVIMDSAPVGPVSDSFALAAHSDVVLYVVRQLYTHKRQLDFLNEIVYQQGKLQHVALVINNVKATGRYGYYGYTGKYGGGYYYGNYNYYTTGKKEGWFSK